MRERDETRDTERNRQMPEQAWIQRILHLKQRADKNGYAQKPGGAANRRCKPGQMNQASTRPCEFLKRRSVIAGFCLEPMKQIPKRKDSFQPQIDPDGINKSVGDDNRGEETLSSRRSEHWRNN